MTASSGHRILITGSRGFVGQSIGREAVKRGWTTLGLSRSAGEPREWGAAHRQADVAVDDLREILNDFSPSIVVHAAGPASVGASFEKPLSDLKASLLSWANLAEAARLAAPGALLVLISSAAVYGQPQRLPIEESHSRKPISPYGYHKLMCELVAREQVECFGAKVLVTRFFSLIGPDQRRLLPWEIFAQLQDPSVGEVVLQGSASDGRDYLHVDDAASAVLSAAQTVSGQEERVLRELNVASGIETSIGAVARAFSERLGNKPVRFMDRHRPGDPNRWQADVSALMGMVPSWEPRSLVEAVEECIERWTA